MQRTEKIIEINAPVERVFDLFSDFESFPRWMSHIKEVRYTGRRYTRWTAEAPLGSSVEWEAETIAFEPDQRIAWRSVRGDVLTEGEVDFQETARGTTLLRVILGYDPPAGRIGTLVARLFGTNPEEQLEEDLERFAEVAEARAGSRRPPARSRGLVDRERELSRRRPEPSGMYDDDYDARDDRTDEAYYREGRALRPEVERGYDSRRSEMRDRGRDYDERGGRHSSLSRREDRSTQRSAGRDRFDSELREALRGQRESMQRYDEDRRRDERSRQLREESVRDEGRLPRRAGRGGPADERRLYETRMRERARLDEEDVRRRDQYGAGAHTTRHAMTPRERELERGRPTRPDFEYRRKAFGRGVDKLLDEQDAPSNRWRRE
jgi:uncharacterized protein YndB with AHSA1/START domain